MTIQATKSKKLRNFMEDLESAGYATEIIQETFQHYEGTKKTNKAYHLSVYSQHTTVQAGETVHRQLGDEDMRTINRLAKKRSLLAFSDRHSTESASCDYSPEANRNEMGLVLLDRNIVTDAMRGLAEAIKLHLDSPYLLRGDEWYAANLATARNFHLTLDVARQHNLFQEDGSFSDTTYGALRVSSWIYHERMEAIEKNAKYYGVKDAGTDLLLRTGKDFCRIM